MNLHRGKGNIIFYGLIKEQTDTAAVFTHHCQTGFQSIFCVAQGKRLPKERYLSERFIQAHNPVWNTDFSLPCKTADSENFPFTDIQINSAIHFTWHIYPQIPDGHGCPGSEF